MNCAQEEKRDGAAEPRSFIDGFVADCCRPHADALRLRLADYVAARRRALVTEGAGDFALAAGVSAPKAAGEVRAPDEEVVFTFASAGAPDAPGAWQAQLRVPPGAGPETPLALALNEETDGVFRLAGLTLPIVAGRAELAFGLFLAGIRDAAVAFRRAGAAQAVPGTLVFF